MHMPMERSHVLKSFHDYHIIDIQGHLISWFMVDTHYCVVNVMRYRANNYFIIMWFMLTLQETVNNLDDLHACR